MAIEELLGRYTTATIFRLATRDVAIGDVLVKKGEQVLNILSMVGLDETSCPHTREVDLDRTKRAHFAFGFGPHICLGRPLAKMELETLFRQWLKAIPSFSLDESHPPAKVAEAMSGASRSYG